MIRAVIRLRSSINANYEVKQTLHYLRLNRVNHCVLLPEGKTYDGMLQKVKDYTTWGEIKPEVLTNMMIKRGKLTGNRMITNVYIKENTKHDSMVKFAEAITNGSFRFKDLKDVKPVFRLHPPHKGFEGIKRSYNDRGSLGYRGEAINDLILKMLEPHVKSKVGKEPKKTATKAPAAPARKVPEAHVKKETAPAPKKPKKAEPKAAVTPKKAPAKKAPAKKEESK